VSETPTICVFGATPVLTVTAEAGTAGREADVHLHAGGQGFWIARMARELGERVVLCSPVGGETGQVFERMATLAGIEVDATQIEGQTAAYLHDRRSGERVEIAHTGYPTLDRHELDSLYGRVVARSLEAELCILAGYPDADSVPTDTFRRLATDLTGQGAPIVADLAGEALWAALEGGLDLLKLSHEELEQEGLIDSHEVSEIARAADELAGRGARRVVVTRAEEPTLARMLEDTYLVRPPQLEVVDHRGAGDATTAGLAVGLRRGLDEVSVLRLGSAAGAATVARHGLASAELGTIEELAGRVEVERLERAER
jgi:1-phosphofructokinase